MPEDDRDSAALLREQVGQLHEAVRQLYGAVSAQCVQLRDSDLALLREMQKLQTGGPQRAMAGVYNKLFRDLLGHMNQLEELIAIARGDGRDPAWVAALTAARDRFEAILRDWGCSPIEVHVGEEEFDPEIHEPAPDSTSTGDAGKIREVRRRGWRNGGGDVLQLPLVVIG